MVVQANLLRRNKLLEAATEVGKRWGDDIIPALTQALGGPPSSTLLQRVRKLAGKVGLDEGILLVNRVIYKRLATPTRGVRAEKAVMPADFRKAADSKDSTPLTPDELKEIGMQFGPSGILISGFVEDHLEDTTVPRELEGPASEITKALSENGTDPNDPSEQEP